VQYHRDNYESLERLHRRLHRLGQGLFFLAAIACALHVISLPERMPQCVLPPMYEYALRFSAIVLPAFGAAFGAIAYHGEFERLCQSSKALAGILQELLQEVDGVGADSKRLGRIAEEFSQAMMSELVDWRFVFLEKDLVLPG
jgi:hypothetical protein